MSDVYQNAYEREKKARQHAEKLLEDKSRELYLVNLALQEQYQEVKGAYDKLQDMQTQLVQSEKMASLGQLAAGVAHEINNPMSFIISNLSMLKEYTASLTEALLLADKTLLETGAEEAAWRQYTKDKDLHFLIGDTTELIQESEHGADRVKAIVEGLKNFARIDADEKQDVDLNECVETTLKMLDNELKYTCKLNTELSELPTFLGYPGQLNQVIMNLLMNAKQAVGSAGNVDISTYVKGDAIHLEVKDDGHGIKRKDLKNLFDPFFTTKPVGEGTGLGLAISYGIIQNHGGKIYVESEEGEGASFTVILPTG